MDSDYIVDNGDGTTTVLLQHTLKSKNSNIDDIAEITLEVPTLGAFEAMDSTKGEIGKMIKMIQALSGLPGAMVRKISMQDLARINTVLDRGGDEKKLLGIGED